VTAGLITDEQTLLYGSASATFDAARVYRYKLVRVWDETRPCAVWVMLNPSKAGAFTGDPTAGRVATFTKAWGLGGFVAVNLYGLIATDPRELARHPDPVGPESDRFIAEVIGPDSVVVCAWGANKMADQRGLAALDIIAARGAHPKCLGVTAAGYPTHPLARGKHYVPAGTELRSLEPEFEAA
jgi:hypothetical protein